MLWRRGPAPNLLLELSTQKVRLSPPKGSHFLHLALQSTIIWASWTSVRALGFQEGGPHLCRALGILK